MPIDVRGKRHIDFGVGLVTGKYCRIECSHSSDSTKKLIFGDNVQINDRVHIDCLKSIIMIEAPDIDNYLLSATLDLLSKIVHNSPVLLYQMQQSS